VNGRRLRVHVMMVPCNEDKDALQEIKASLALENFGHNKFPKIPAEGRL
jgi:hypothetical protein